MKLNVVMLVCGRERLTQQAIDSLAMHTSSPYCLTVVDEPGKRKEPLYFVSDAFVHTLNNPKPGCTGAARNAGIAAARERFGTEGLLYCSDNDVWFAPGWDTALLEAYRLFGERVKIIGGGCHPFLQHNKAFVGHMPQHSLLSRDAISGYSWLLDWDTWDAYGPLDAHAQGVRQSEDYAMCQKIIKDGYYVASVTPEVVIHTGLTDSFGNRPPGWELMAQAIPPGVIAE